MPLLSLRPALLAVPLSVLASGAAACAPFIDVSHPTTGLLEPASNCAPAHIQEPLILAATHPAGAHLEPAGAWGDDRLQHARQTTAEIPFGKGQVATAGSDRLIDLWDKATGRLLAHVDFEDEPSFAVVSAAGDLFVRDGKGHLVGIDGATNAVRFRTVLPGSTWRLAMSGDERHVQVDGEVDFRVDVVTGKLAAGDLYPEISPKSGATFADLGLLALAFDPTTKRAARLVGAPQPRHLDPDEEPGSRGDRGRGSPLRSARLDILDVTTGKLLGSTKHDFEPPVTRPFRLAFDPSGAAVRLDEIRDGRVRKRTRWSAPDGALLGAEDASDKVEDNPSFPSRKPLRGQPVWRLAVSADGRAGAFRDGDGIIWLTGEDGSACALHRKAEPIPRVFSLDADGGAINVARGDRDLVVERWDTRRRARTGTFAIDHLYWITLLSGSRAILERDAWGLDRSPPPERDHFFVDLSSSEPPRWLTTPDAKPGARWELENAVFTADAKTVFATPNYGAMLSAWDVDGGDKLYDIGYIREHEPLALSPDGLHLAFLSSEGTGPRLYDVKARKVLPVRLGGDIFWALAFSSDGRALAMAGQSGLVTLVSVPEGDVIATADLRERADWPTTLAFGGDHLWIGTARGAVFRVKLAGRGASP